MDIKTDKVPVSIAIITHNEEHMLGPCLESVRRAADVVVLDSGSTDRTLDIARSYGARVFSESWKGYGLQKNSAVDKCVSQWVLILDADERVPPETMSAIEKIVTSAPVAGAYEFRRKNYFRGQWYGKASGWPDYQRRLVQRGKGGYERGVHEEWILQEGAGPVIRLKEHLDHHSYADYSAMLRKLEEYSTLSALELYKAGKRAGFGRALLSGLSMFLRVYLLEGAILHGMDGFVIAQVKGLGAFYKYAKLAERLSARQTSG